MTLVLPFHFNTRKSPRHLSVQRKQKTNQSGCHAGGCAESSRRAAVGRGSGGLPARARLGTSTASPGPRRRPGPGSESRRLFSESSLEVTVEVCWAASESVMGRPAWIGQPPAGRPEVRESRLSHLARRQPQAGGRDGMMTRKAASYHDSDACPRPVYDSDCVRVSLRVRTTSSRPGSSLQVGLPLSPACTSTSGGRGPRPARDSEAAAASLSHRRRPGFRRGLRTRHCSSANPFSIITPL